MINVLDLLSDGLDLHNSQQTKGGMILLIYEAHGIKGLVDQLRSIIPQLMFVDQLSKNTIANWSKN